MARIALTLMALWASVPTFAVENPLLGTWQFQLIRYRGKEMPRPNPHLILTLQFGADGVDVLRWSREGEPGFCERKARYVFADEKLTQEVFWINPDNAPECAKDPDMQLNVKSETPARLAAGRFETDFKLDDEPLIYLWSKIDPTGEKIEIRKSRILLAQNGGEGGI